MQVKKCLITVLFSLSLMPSNSNTGLYDYWLSVKNFFGSVRWPTFQVPQYFESPTLKKVGFSVGALAIVGVGYWYKKRKNRVSQNPNNLVPTVKPNETGGLIDEKNLVETNS